MCAFSKSRPSRHRQLQPNTQESPFAVTRHKTPYRNANSTPAKQSTSNKPRQTPPIHPKLPSVEQFGPVTFHSQPPGQSPARLSRPGTAFAGNYAPTVHNENQRRPWILGPRRQGETFMPQSTQLPKFGNSPMIPRPHNTFTSAPGSIGPDRDTDRDTDRLMHKTAQIRGKSGAYRHIITLYTIHCNMVKRATT